jgi:dolichol-phosphate mannosyltransferase
MTLSVVIPAHNEEGSIADVVLRIRQTLDREAVPHEIVVVDDHSSDATRRVVEELSVRFPSIRCISNPDANGYGLAVRAGLDVYRGDAVAIVMADGSDSPDDLVVYYRKLCEGWDCVFGSRFVRGARVEDYPWPKLIINRVANLIVRILFRISLNDTTNAFKCYRRETIDGVRPLLSKHFNLTVEMPLKAITRGYTHCVVPISWQNRAHGVSKLKLKEMGSRYLFIVLYVFLERLLTRGDYHRGAPNVRA